MAALFDDDVVMIHGDADVVDYGIHLDKMMPTVRSGFAALQSAGVFLELATYGVSLDCRWAGIPNFPVEFEVAFNIMSYSKSNILVSQYDVSFGAQLVLSESATFRNASSNLHSQLRIEAKFKFIRNVLVSVGDTRDASVCLYALLGFGIRAIFIAKKLAPLSGSSQSRV